MFNNLNFHFNLLFLPSNVLMNKMILNFTYTKLNYNPTISSSQMQKCNVQCFRENYNFELLIKHKVGNGMPCTRKVQDESLYFY